MASRRVGAWVAQCVTAHLNDVGLYVGILIGNSVLTEIVFSRPGLGRIIVGALNQRDYTMLQGLLVIYCFLIVVVNLLTDLAYGLLDPRVREA